MDPLSRRRLLSGLVAGGLGAAGAWSLRPRRARAARADDEGPRFLVVFGCFGGASMIDCFLPVDQSRAATHPDRGRVISHAVVAPPGSAISCPDRGTPYDFLSAHGAQSVVMGAQASSVNHLEAQRRSVNGRGAFAGRTLCEAVADAYGAAMPLPNLNMGRGGFSEPGVDAALDPRYRAELVTNPVTFALSTHGYAGVLPAGGARALEDPEALGRLVGRARALRDETLEAASPFARTFEASRLRRELLGRRAAVEPWMEEEGLIRELLYVPDLGEIFPIGEYGLEASDEAWRIDDYLPRSWPASTSGVAQDRLQAQAALAYLLIRNQVSAAVTLTDPGTDGFLAFDQSHGGHASAQSAHWDRALDVASRLIGLLSTAEYVGPSGVADGTSCWDRTMIVFATEFGRDKWDTGGSFGTGHHMNNGLLAVSPLLQGNQALGAADPDNGFICGFDSDTGAPTPFEGLAPGEDPAYDDPRLPPGEERLFGGLLDVLGVTFEGQQSLPAIRRS